MAKPRQTSSSTEQADQQEANSADVAMQAALVAIGVASLDEALKLWASVDPARVAVTGEAWLARATAMVLSRRAQARELALAYYRLVRALRAGSTTPRPGDRATGSVTLSQLRHEFAGLLEDAHQAPATEAGKLAWERGREGDDSLPVDDYAPGSGDREVPIEQPWDDDEDFLDDDKEAIKAFEESYYDRANALHKATTVDLERKVNRAKRRDLKRDRQARGWTDPYTLIRRRIAGETGITLAAAVQKTTLDAGRTAVEKLTVRDRDDIGWVRVSKTGTPCGFCAMLMSRGPVYTSKASAERDGGGDKYHDGCQCEAVMVVGRDSYYTDPRFRANRYLYKLWPEVTKGLGGASAVNAWRNWLDANPKWTLTPFRRAAQEAA